MAVSTAQVASGAAAVKITAAVVGENDGESILVSAPAANTAAVFIGPAGVTTATGYPLAAGATFPSNGVPLPLGAGEDLYVISAAAQTVNVFRQGL